MLAIYTIGHSTRSAADLVDLLRQHKVETLVDIRTFPGSRHCSQFNQENMQVWVEEAGIAYRHIPKLGGRRRSVVSDTNAGWKVAAFRSYADHMATPEFSEGIDALENTVGVCSIMCSEAVWWRCHRRLVSDALLTRGRNVIHILGPNRSEPHRLTPFAAVNGVDLTYPAVPVIT